MIVAILRYGPGIKDWNDSKMKTFDRKRRKLMTSF